MQQGGGQQQSSHFLRLAQKSRKRSRNERLHFVSQQHGSQQTVAQQTDFGQGGGQHGLQHTGCGQQGSQQSSHFFRLKRSLSRSQKLFLQQQSSTTTQQEGAQLVPQQEPPQSARTGVTMLSAASAANANRPFLIRKTSSREEPDAAVHAAIRSIRCSFLDVQLGCGSRSRMATQSYHAKSRDKTNPRTSWQNKVGGRWPQTRLPAEFRQATFLRAADNSMQPARPRS